jgi:hypothetical protein
MEHELSKTEQTGTIHSVTARLLVLFFALLMFTMFRTVLYTGWAIYWDALCAIGWAGNLFWIKPLTKSFFNGL